MLAHLQGKQFPITRNETAYFQMHVSISEFVDPLCCMVLGCSILHPKEYNKTIQLMATSSYYNPTTLPVVNL